MSQDINTTSRKTGKIMSLIAWLIGIALLTQFFAAREEKAFNPNADFYSTSDTQRAEIVLQQNKQGHYIVRGSVNSIPAIFLLDTGASDVVIPADLSTTYKLKGIGFSQGITANGTVVVEQTIIEELSIGSINLYNVRASINPGMSSSQPILLGMSALKRLELKQKNSLLTITQIH